MNNNNKSRSQAVNDYRRRRKENLIKVCGSKCNICGYNKTNSALEFHHIDASQKKYGIASKGTCHDLESDLLEVSKCILVCANCHREIHDGQYTQQELKEKQSFNIQIANKLRKNKEKKIYYCVDCGKEIEPNVNGYCMNCFLKHRWQDKGYPEREELKEMIRTMPFTQIATKYGVSDNAIRKWCKKFNLPFKKTEINKIDDNDWLKI